MKIEFGRSAAICPRGKLTAKLEKRSAVSGQQVRNRLIPNPYIPNPLFAVRTPTAVVTDLGTEFGVEVRDGLTDAHVYRGLIEVEVVDGRSGPAKAVRLHGTRLDPRAGGRANKTASVSRVPISPRAFVRRLPKQVPIRVLQHGRESGAVGARSALGNRQRQQRSCVSGRIWRSLYVRDSQ